MTNAHLAVFYLASVGLAVVAWLLLLGRVLAKVRVVRQLAGAGAGPPDMGAQARPAGASAPGPMATGIPAWAALPADLATPLARWLFVGQRQAVETWLRQGGASPLTADRFLGFKLALCLWAAALGLALGPIWLLPLLPAAYLGADALLRQRALRRRQQLAAEAPNLLDLASTCLKGGMTVHAVLDLAAQVWREGPLREELQTVRRELSLHQPLDRVLTDLVRRTGSDELDACVQAFCQGGRLGVPVADATRAQASILRHQRVERAKDLAHRAEAKITLVSTLLAMPTTFLFVAGSLLYAMLARPAVFGFQWFHP